MVKIVVNGRDLLDGDKIIAIESVWGWAELKIKYPFDWKTDGKWVNPTAKYEINRVL
jgi:hypothetical protein